jgi:hypothetical protein
MKGQTHLTVKFFFIKTHGSRFLSKVDSLNCEVLFRKTHGVPRVVRLLDFYERPDSFLLILSCPSACKVPYTVTLLAGKIYLTTLATLANVLSVDSDPQGSSNTGSYRPSPDVNNSFLVRVY